MEGVLPIRGVDGSTGEALSMGPATGLREASDPYRVEVVRWAALDVPSIMVEEDLTKLREEYRIPSDIDLILPEPTERACFSEEGLHGFTLECLCEWDAIASPSDVQENSEGV
ncbi:hypothetical protein Adt_22770 [Abeliophyllum distichum]|uniref:Uncharacterized protein n=1 Tax=Abeliophyllum distichum TaxID=126358 RepID=A0ABD1S9B3_9LAMI